MQEYILKDMAIKFLKYHHTFRQQESIRNRRYNELLGGIVSWASPTESEVFDNFINQVPIKCEWFTEREIFFRLTKDYELILDEPK